MGKIDLGSVIGLVYRGTYQPTITYNKNDVVYFNGSSFVAKKTSTNITPVDGTDWGIVVLGGSSQITATPADIGKVLQVGAHGASQWGVKIIQPTTPQLVKTNAVFDNGKLISEPFENHIPDSTKPDQTLKSDATNQPIWVDKPTYEIPDPTGEDFGNLIVTDGHDNYQKFPFKLDDVSTINDGDHLTIDTTNNKIKFDAPSVGSLNPSIPTPNSSTNTLPLISEGGVYKLGNPEQPITSTDTNKVRVWNGTIFEKKDASALDNQVIPILTPADKNKVLQGDAAGLPKWGVKITPPVALVDGSTKNAVFDDQGNIIGGEDGAVITAPAGDYLVAVRDGKLKAITNHTDYVQSSFWSVHNRGHIITHPFPQSNSAVGIQCTNMIKNNSGAGIDQPLRVSDVWTSDETMGDGLPNSILDVTAATGRTHTQMHDRLMAYDTSTAFLNWMRPSAKNKIRHNITSIANDIMQYNGSQYLYLKNDSALPQNNPIRISSTNTQTIDIPFVKVGVAQHHSSNMIDFNLTAFGRFGDPDITLTITFTELKISTYSANTTTRNFKCRLITSSSTAITGDNLIDLGGINKGTIKTYPLTLSTEVTGASPSTTVPNLFHEKGKGALNNVLYYGCIFENERDLPADETSSIFYNLKGHINIKRAVAASGAGAPRTDGRYEFKTLKEISNLTGNSISTPIPTDYTGAFIGGKPKLKAGKIIIAYCILFHTTPADMNSFKIDYAGISTNSFTVESMPSIFLENQTGTNKYTHRIEAVKRHSMSQEMQIYELDCTQAQFDSWKLVVYFHTTVAEARFKEIAKKVGATLWFVNSEDVPN